jgi:hypothetical protein
VFAGDNLVAGEGKALEQTGKAAAVGEENIKNSLPETVVSPLNFPVSTVLCRTP